MLKYTGSSDQGLGLCCKPGFSGKHCYSSDTMICSQPASADDTKSPFTDILTDGKMNH